MNDGNRRKIVVAAERKLAVDPTRVWALLANPERVEEWAGVALVGYMGTELPKVGQIIFVRSKRWGGLAKTWRVEIESWDAGSAVRCLVHSDRSSRVIGFEVAIHPEVVRNGVHTKVRLVQKLETPVALAGIARWWTSMQLKRRIDRVDMAVNG